MFGIPFWLIKWGAGALVITALGWQVYSLGRQSVLDDLKDDRIQILRDGKAIDNEVDLAGDDGLCALLGGCGVRDSAGSN